MQINWYPGHMTKAKRLLQEQIGKVDLVIELCDARLPLSSRNPELVKMLKDKKHLLIMNKSDLADQSVNSRWIDYFKKQGIEAHLLNANRCTSKDEILRIENATKDVTERAAAKGIRKTVRAMVVGVPNVGKSTYINRLRGEHIAETGDKPGVTKSNRWIKITPYLDLLDTPGLLWPRFDNQKAAVRLCYIGTIKDGITDVNELAIQLLYDMDQVRPDYLEERFKIRQHGLTGVDLLDEVCKGRGFLLKGNQYDYDRCSSTVLDEFRAGKLGKVSFEKPD